MEINVTKLGSKSPKEIFATKVGTHFQNLKVFFMIVVYTICNNYAYFVFNYYYKM